MFQRYLQSVQQFRWPTTFQRHGATHGVPGCRHVIERNSTSYQVPCELKLTFVNWLIKKENKSATEQVAAGTVCSWVWEVSWPWLELHQFKDRLCKGAITPRKGDQRKNIKIPWFLTNPKTISEFNLDLILCRLNLIFYFILFLIFLKFHILVHEPFVYFR